VIGRLRHRLRELATDGASGRRRWRCSTEWPARRLHDDVTEQERQTLIAAVALRERVVQR
jgi:hypothetical protein